MNHKRLFDCELDQELWGLGKGRQANPNYSIFYFSIYFYQADCFAISVTVINFTGNFLRWLVSLNRALLAGSRGTAGETEPGFKKDHLVSDSRVWGSFQTPVYTVALTCSCAVLAREGIGSHPPFWSSPPGGRSINQIGQLIGTDSRF